uniref:HTH-type transcriptional regulator TtuA n=1 Tax=Rhizobium etli TaxID=29449 RepID=Q8RMZ7_RHIET|nr:katG regulator [Rhizobium etli]
MKNLTLKQLRYFEALARDGRFRRAAGSCAVSQPALSMQIKELEQELGSELFERSAREVKLTPFGQTFALRVRDILRAVDELGEFARASRDSFLTRLRIGIIPTIAPYLLPLVHKRLNKSFAGIQIEVRETHTGKLVHELAQGQLDMAIVALPVSEPSLTELSLFRGRIRAGPAPPGRRKPVPEREALREMRLLLLEEGHCFRDQALSFCKVGAARPREIMEGSSLSTLVQMVGAGIGITLIPEMAVPVETRRAHVSISRFPSPAPRRTIGMVWLNFHPMGNHLPWKLAKARSRLVWRKTSPSAINGGG